MGGRLGAHAAACALRRRGSGVAQSRFRAARPPALVWALPAIVVVELCGSTFGAPLVFSLLFYAAVVALLFHDGAAPAFARSRRVRRCSGVVLLLLGVLGAWLGLPNTGAPELARLGSEARVALACFGCWSVALALPWCAARRASWRDLERFGCLLAAGFAWLLASGHRVQRLAVFPDDGSARLLALGAAGVLLGLAATAGRWQRARLVLLVGVGVYLRVLGLGVWQPDPNVRDMLPLVEAAGAALARGDSPYGLYAMQRGSVVPLTYLPGLWLLHELPRALGLAVRTMSLVADAAVVLSLWWAASGGGPADGLARWRARCLALALSAVWLLSPSVQWNAIYAEPHPYWGLLTLLFAATLRGRFTLAAALLGLAIATRQFAWVLAPFWLLWAARELGFVRALKQLLLAGTVALGLLVPFVAAEPEAFWFGTLRWFADYGPAHRTWFLERLGFAGSFYAARAEGWLIPLAAAVALGGIGLGFRSRTPRAFSSLVAATYTLVIMLCPVLWSSFYLDCFLLISLAVLCDLRSTSVWPSSGPGRPLPRAYGLALALAGALSCWLVYSFWNSVSERGLAAAHAALLEHARPGDVLVDRSRSRVAFVQPPLVAAPPSVHVVGSEFDASLGDAGVFPASRIGLVVRESRDGPLALGLRRVGHTIAEGRSGEYAWLWVAPDPVLGRLSAGLSGGVFRTRHGVFPLEPTPERGLAPRIPSVIDVRETSCLIGAKPRHLVFAHPSELGALELTFTAPARARRLLLFAGFDDRVVLWGRAEAKLAVRFGGVAAGELSVPNLPGVAWQVFSLPPAQAPGRLELVLTTTHDRQRWLCLDGAWL